MHLILTMALDAVGIPYKARFSIEEVAEVLAIRREQVVDLLKKGRLRGIKSSPSRWRWIYADDLGDYLDVINAPVNPVSEHPHENSTQAVVQQDFPASHHPVVGDPIQPSGRSNGVSITQDAAQTNPRPTRPLDL